MEKKFSLISLLYELSLTNLKHLKPEDNARKFIKKILSRKALNYGAIWELASIEENRLFYTKLYSMPDLYQSGQLKIKQFNKLFEEGNIAVTESSIFEGRKMKGHFAYFKLNEFGILELCSENDADKLSLKSVYPFGDVVAQLANSIESGYSYHNLQAEIQQRKKAEQSLRKYEEKYRNIIDNIKLGLLEVDDQEIITYANKSFQELVGYRLDELIGKKASDLFLRHQDKESRREIEQQNAARTKGESGSYEFGIYDKYGRKKYFIISGAPNYNDKGELVGSIGIHLDITEQKKLLIENEFKEARLKKLYQNSLDAIISIDEKGLIIDWNRKAEEIFGYQHKEAIGKLLENLIIPREHRDAHRAGLKNYLRTGVGPVLNQRIEITALKKSGKVIPVELTITPLEYAGEHYFTAFIRDITQLKNYQQSMEGALEQQKELNSMKTRFISMTSHELRTPLTTIRSNTEILNYYLENAEELNREKLTVNVERIDKNVERLNQLISNILLLGKLDSKRIPFNPAAEDAEKLIRNFVVPNLPASFHQIKVNVTGKKYNILLDKILFMQIMNNLLENAIKYTPDQRLPEITLAYQPRNLVVSVQDFGIGIPQKDQDHLFDSFFRASNVDNIQGTGLGLAIVKEFVQLHGGLIKVDSELDVGTTFIIFLPNNTLS